MWLQALSQVVAGSVPRWLQALLHVVADPVTGGCRLCPQVVAGSVACGCRLCHRWLQALLLVVAGLVQERADWRGAVAALLPLCYATGQEPLHHGRAGGLTTP